MQPSADSSSMVFKRDRVEKIEKVSENKFQTKEDTPTGSWRKVGETVVSRISPVPYVSSPPGLNQPWKGAASCLFCTIG